jgi:hypothetical protein
MEFREFTLVGPQYLIVDASFAPSAEDGVLVDLPPGRYHVQITGIDYGGDKRIARLRAVLSGAAPTLGKQLGETWTDTAMTGICDCKVFSKS